MEISTQPLTEEAFAPFGQVIAMGPLGRAHSTRYAADVENKRAAARSPPLVCSPVSYTHLTLPTIYSV